MPSSLIGRRVSQQLSKRVFTTAAHRPLLAPIPSSTTPTSSPSPTPSSTSSRLSTAAPSTAAAPARSLGILTNAGLQPKLNPAPPAASEATAEMVRQREAARLAAQRTAQYNDERLQGMNGGQIFCEMMAEHSVRHIFGYPGGCILSTFDAIYQSPHNFTMVLPRHEQGGGHMAEGYARASGQPGVLLVTSGPGATNCITPMQDAMSDGIPLVVFTGQVPTTALGSDAFQEADVLGISRFCTKWNTMVKDITDLPRAIRQAFLIATSGRPGPVLVDLPKDVMTSVLNRPVNSAPAVPSFYKFQLQQEGRKAEQREAAERAARLINGAKRPILYVGAGALNQADVLREVAVQANIPVTTTLQGMGVFDELHPLSLHMLGMHGSAYANLAMQHADCIVAVGARFDDRVTGNLKMFAPAAKQASREGRGGIVHLEIMSKNINKTVDADVCIEGDCGDSLQAMKPFLTHAPRAEWMREIDEWKARFPWYYVPPVGPDAPIKPQSVIEELDRQVADYKERVLITTGVGQHQMWAAQWYRWRHPRTMITSGGLGTMGFGLPAAIGAKVAQPDKVVVDIDGDASLSMTAMELMTAAEFNVKVKVIVLNNNFQGMVKQWQDLFYSKRYQSTPMKNPDWPAFAASMGVKGIKVTKAEELPAKMREFLQYDDGPVLMEVLVDEHEHVYPMVPAGKALDEMVLAPKQ